MKYGAIINVTKAGVQCHYLAHSKHVEATKQRAQHTAIDSKLTAVQSFLYSMNESLNFTDITLINQQFIPPYRITFFYKTI